MVKKTKKKTAIQRSDFGTIHLVDILNGLYHAFGAAIPAMIALFNVDAVPSIGVTFTVKQVIWIGLFTFVSAFIADFTKRMNTNSKGEAFKGENN